MKYYSVSKGASIFEIIIQEVNETDAESGNMDYIDSEYKIKKYRDKNPNLKVRVNS